MLLLTIFLPLFAFLAVSLGGRFIGKQGAAIITIVSLSLALLITLFSFSVFETSIYFHCFDWINFGSLKVPFELIFDNITFVMLVVVLSISLVVHIYSTDYLKHDPHLPRFLSYLSLFTFFMLILISAENLLQLFLGWEGVGLCSYLLISFWFTRIQAGKAALKAVFVNKIGDLALLVAMSLIYYVYGSLSLSVIFSLTPYVTSVGYAIGPWAFSVLDLIGLFLVIGVVGKSAQLGLHVWLPDAMEGPTPVSALLHAATMVTAGVFLVIRCSFFFEHVPHILTFCMFLGSLTAFFAATTGLLQNDIKRIIAFSTCSQLGYMLASCGNSQYQAALFHLFNHAFFKALLFLAAGSVIHALADEQDIRKMGSLAIFLPLTFSFFFVASFSLMGLPYLSGFFSKDFIIEQFSANSHVNSFFFIFLLLGGALCTAAYSFRLLFYVFLTRPNFNRNLLKTITEPVNRVQIPLLVLVILSIFSGWLTSDFFVGIGTTAFSHAIALRPEHSLLIESEFLNVFVKQLPLICSLSGWFIAFFVCTQTKPLLLTETTLYYSSMFLNQKWFFDKLYNTLALRFMKNAFYSFYAFLDKGIIEFFGPTGLYRIFWSISLNLRFYQGGIVSYYFFSILLFFFFLLFVILVIL